MFKIFSNFLVRELNCSYTGLTSWFPFSGSFCIFAVAFCKKVTYSTTQKEVTTPHVGHSFFLTHTYVLTQLSKSFSSFILYYMMHYSTVIVIFDVVFFLCLICMFEGINKKSIKVMDKILSLTQRCQPQEISNLDYRYELSPPTPPKKGNETSSQSNRPPCPLIDLSFQSSP